jgi:hypothetical protein
MGTISKAAAIVRTRHCGCSEGNELHEILGEEEVQRPIQGHTHLLLEAWEFAQVDRAPQPPGQESRKLPAENLNKYHGIFVYFQIKIKF